MPALLALAPAALLLLAGPASAQQDADSSADTGFPIAIVVLAVVAVAFALVWRAVSKKRQDSDS